MSNLTEKNYDLIAFDLDGTVFGTPTNQVVSPRVCAAFEAAHAAGVTIAVASGRPAWMLGEHLPATPWLDWAICCNGSRVAPMHAQGEGFSACFSRELAVQVLAAIEELGGSMTLHTDSESLMEKRHIEHLVAVFDENERDHGIEAPAGNPIDRLMAQFSAVAVDSAAEAFAERPDAAADKMDVRMPSPKAADVLEARLEELGGVAVARLDETNFELTAASASKGNACEELCRRLGIDPARTVAFGDSGNDLSMAGRDITFVAMGNATDEVKAAADAVTDSVFKNGVATWLEANL